MYLKIMISVSIAALAGALFVTNPNYRVFLQFAVCSSAVLVVLHTVRAKAQYLWAGTFGGVAFLFNPIRPIAFPSLVFFVLNLVCMALFAVYYRAYKAKPRLSMASVIDRSSGQRLL